MANRGRGATTEFRFAGARTVIGCLLGLVATNGPVMLFTFSLFLGPLTEALYASRGTISLGLTAMTLVAGLAHPGVGIILDRYGAVRLLACAVPLFALAVAALGTATSPIMFIVIFGFVGLFAAANSPLPYAKIIADRFDAGRGTALGLAMAGIGVGAIAAPQWVRFLIDAVGWRQAYAGLGGAALVLPLIALCFFIREDSTSRRKEAATNASTLGLSAAEALRGTDFWTIVVTIVMLTLVGNGVIAHAVPLFVERGVSRESAHAMLGALGLASMAGRLCTGFLFDRFFAPFVAAGVVVIAFVGIALLAFGHGTPSALLAICCVGFAIGSEVDMIGYLTGRYFGRRHYGQIAGYFFAAFVFSSGVGPVLLGAGFDMTGSYDVALWGFMAALMVSLVMVLRLRAYPFAPVLIKGD